MKKKIYVLLSMALILAACDSPSIPEPDDNLDHEEELGFVFEDVQLSELPFLSTLTADPAVLSPGESVQIKGAAGMSGTLTLTNPSGEQVPYDFTNGTVEIDVPGSAVDGLYKVVVENQFGALAFGGFRVSSLPGIWLSADQTHLDRQGEVRLTVTSHQIPDNMTAVFQVGFLATLGDDLEDDFDPDTPIDFGAFEGPSGILIPGADGRLGPGSFPGVPVAELTNRILYLPGRFANTIQIQLIDPELYQMMTESGGFFEEDGFDEGGGEGIFLSNSVSITACSQPGEIRGDLGAPGVVRALALGGDFPVSMAETGSGPFSLQVSAGDVLITAWNKDGLTPSAYDPQMVKVSCGERVDVGLQMAQESNINFNDLELAAHKLAAPLLPSRNLQGKSQNICRSLFIADIRGNSEDASAYLGSWTTQLFQQLSRVSVMNASDIRALLRLGAQQQLLGTSEEDSVDFYALAGALGTDFLLHSSVNEFEDQYYANWSLIRMEDAVVVYRAMQSSAIPEGLIDLPAELLAAAQKADICAKINPTSDILAPDESIELEIEMTDLNGEAFDKVEISVNQPNCGELEWTEKDLEALTVTNKYTANETIPCRDTLKFIGKTRIQGGMIIESRPAEATAILEKTNLWDFVMTLNAQFDESNHADFTWNGDLYITEEKLIKGKGVGAISGQGGCHIIENGAVVFEANDLIPNGSFEFEFGGRAEALEGEPDRLLVTLMGYTWNFSIENLPEQCNWDFFLQIATEVFKQLALQPQSFLQQGNFQISAQHGDQSEYPIIGLDGTFVITLTKEGGAAP